MSIRQTISSAESNRHAIILTAKGKDDSIETREAETYSYQTKNYQEYFYCYNIDKQGTKKFLVSNILSVEETNHTFSPRWPIEV